MSETTRAISLSPVVKTSKFNKKLNTDFLFDLLVFYSATALFIIPYDSFPHAQLVIPILTIIFLFKLFTSQILLKKSDLILIVIILLICCINISSPRIIDSFFIIILLISCQQPRYLNRKYVKFIYFYVLGSIVIQILFFDLARVEGREALSVSDPNYSAYLILLFSLFCYKNNFKLTCFVLSISSIFLFNSRSFTVSFLAFLLFLLLEKFLPKISKYINSTFDKNKFINFLILILALNLFILSYSIFFVYSVATVTDLKSTGESIERLVKFKDESNFSRFLSNVVFLEIMSKNIDVACWGIPEQSREYIHSLFSFRNGKKLNVLHNSLFDFILRRGIIFSLFYFIALGIIVMRSGNNNLKYIIPGIIWPLFYWGAYKNVGLAFFVIIIALPYITSSQIRRRTH